VPLEVAQLQNLESLDLSGNQLATLPGSLADLLEEGLRLKLADNPLREPFRDLVKLGPDAIAAYLRSLADAIPQYEAKMLLVGEGNVGKTSLAASLRAGSFIEQRPTTHGLEIHPLVLAHPQLNVDIDLRVWDFGGQEVYRITHQFFFSRRALYLLVWQPRQGREQNVEGWLRRIRLRVGQDARVLIVATHSEERSAELDYPRLERMFPGMLAGQYAVDNRTGAGVDLLRKAIAEEAARLPQMGQLINRRWTKAREVILALTEPRISYSMFESICQHHEINSNEALTFAAMLHDLGEIIYYGDDEGLRNIVILDPAWLTRAVSYILEDGPTHESGGILYHTRLKDIWRSEAAEPTYPPSDHAYFLRLMEKFDISYRVDEGSSLVAQLVPYERPSLPWDHRTPIPEDVRSLGLVCELSEPAPGLIAWLTVRHHRASTGKHWRAGVFLRHPISAYASEALVELQDDRHVVIEVRAPSPDLFFNVLRDSLEDLITRRWPGLTYRLLVPCSTRLEDGTTCPGRIGLDAILRRRERGMETISCAHCAEDLDITGLLTGFALPVQLQPELVALQSQLSDLRAGVERLEVYAADTANSTRRVLAAASNEVPDCPHLFTLVRKRESGLLRPRRRGANYRLTLWCEQPGVWHPWPAAAYQCDLSMDTLSTIAPYATLVSRALRVAVPVAGAVAGMGSLEEMAAQAQQEIEQMDSLNEVSSQRRSLDYATDEADGDLTLPEGAGLRALRALLLELDPPQAFGGLRRVLTPSGDFIWVCSIHYPDYDPGLPSLPGG
jgi:hypothetical protein